MQNNDTAGIEMWFRDNTLVKGQFRFGHFRMKRDSPVQHDAHALYIYFGIVCKFWIFVKAFAHWMHTAFAFSHVEQPNRLPAVSITDGGIMWDPPS